jgi:hypothetical protein
MASMTKKKEPGKTRLELAAERMAQTKALHDSLLAQKRAKDQSANRKIENRKKILMGSFLADYMSESDDNKSRMMTPFDAWLTRDSDRAVFGLSSISAPSADLNSEAS